MLPGMRRLKTAMTALLGVGFLASAARSEADAAAKQVPLGTPTRTARGRGDEPTELPDDPELPALTVIREQGVVTAVPFLGLGSGPVELRVRGYTQGSRATLEARNEDLHLAIKVYAKDAEPEARLYEALAAAGLAGNSGARVPRLLAWDRDLRLLVIDWLDGATLDQLVCRGQGARAGELAADWLHRMASLPVMPGQPVAATGVLQQVAQWVNHLGALDPALGLAATDVFERLARTQPPEGMSTLVHGTLYARHLIDLGDGPGVIDWQRFGRGPLELDAGVFLATAWRIGLRDERFAGEVARAEEAFLARTEGLLDERALAWHWSAALLRFAHKQHRRCEDWLAPGRALVSEAAWLAEAASDSRGTVRRATDLGTVAAAPAIARPSPSSAVADLVRRDPSIPGLATVLEPEVFAAALREAAPEVDLRSAEISYLRYKPRDYCRATYRLGVGGSELDVDVRAFLPEEFGAHLGQRDPAVSGPLGPGRIALERRCVLIHAFPNDLKLGALPLLADPREREGLLRELLPDRPGLWQSELQRLRYRPERRYVAALCATGGRADALLKCSTPRAYLRAKRNAEAFRSRGALRIARLLGCSERHRLLAFEWIPGRPLMDLCTASEADCKAVAAAGEALATLHAQSPAGLERWTREAEGADLLSVASEVGFITPRLARRADELARGLAARLADAPDLCCPLHGDFSANQVVVMGRQEVAIVDLDWACYGDPADDLGNFIAQAERNVLRGDLPRERLESLRDSLLAGYEAHRALPERIRLYTAVEVFRRSRFPFRVRERDWPRQIEALIGRAEVILGTLA